MNEENEEQLDEEQGEAEPSQGSVGTAPDYERIARVCHEANRALCQAFGDESQLPWPDAALWQHESAIKGVAFAIDNPNASPAAQHEAWVADKLADGWRKGPTKDPARKVHNCLVPYAELPPEQKAKDHVFRAIVRAMTEVR